MPGSRRRPLRLWGRVVAASFRAERGSAMQMHFTANSGPASAWLSMSPNFIKRRPVRLSSLSIATATFHKHFRDACVSRLREVRNTSCYHHLMSRTGRKKVAWLGLSALLFLQLAVAAYACPTPMERGSSIAAAADVQAPPCQGIDQERPKICEQHCVQDSQSVDTQPHSGVNAPLLPLLAVVVQSDLHFATGRGVHGAPLAAVVDPPPLVRFGVLRI
jgi:hypothetical protein